MDCRAVGLVVTGLGGNRRREDDAIDPRVGLSRLAPVGAPRSGPTARWRVVHARGDASADGGRAPRCAAASASRDRGRRAARPSARRDAV